MIFNDHDLSGGLPCVKLAPEGQTVFDQAPVYNQEILDNITWPMSSRSPYSTPLCTICEDIVGKKNKTLYRLSRDPEKIAYHFKAKYVLTLLLLLCRIVC